MCHAIFNLKGVFSLGVCYGEHTFVISFFLVSGILSGEPLPSLSPRTLSLDCARCSGVTPRKSIAFTSVPENKGRTNNVTTSHPLPQKVHHQVHHHHCCLGTRLQTWCSVVAREQSTCFQKCRDHSHMMRAACYGERRNRDVTTPACSEQCVSYWHIQFMLMIS